MSSAAFSHGNGVAMSRFVHPVCLVYRHEKMLDEDPEIGELPAYHLCQGFAAYCYKRVVSIEGHDHCLVSAD
eukprot:12921474-Prorocentrum_lima.AAC.1